MNTILRFVLVAALTLAASAPAHATIIYSPPFPEGTVGYALPPVGIRVATSGGERILSATVAIDGTTYQARREGSLLVYRPASPLAAGRHTAEVEVVFDGRWRPITERWEFTVVRDALTSLPAETAEQRAVLDAVNRHRSEADLSPLRLNPSLNAAATAHARYYVTSPTEGLGAHTEDPDRPGFTGIAPWDRGTYFGYPFLRYYEDMHFLPDHRRAVRDWLDSVYHRFPLIDPEVRDLGYGFATDGVHQANVLNVATTGDGSGEENGSGAGAPATDQAGQRGVATPPDPVEITVYPIPGQRRVPTRWDGNEEPDPYRLFPGARAAGYPVTLQFNPTHVAASTVDYASMADEKGNLIPIWLVTGNNDEHVAPNIALLPSVDLSPGTRYTVRVRGSVRLVQGETRTFDKQWWFTTEGAQERIIPVTDIRVFVNGRPLQTDVPPAWKNGRVMLPFRALLESLGATVEWDADRGNVVAALDNRRFFVKIGNDRAIVDDRVQRLDAAPYISNGRTLVPVRFAAEALGFQVRWDGARRSVSLDVTPET